MADGYSKNSLLGQLEQKGILNEDSKNGEYLPFGILTGSSDMSPFNMPFEEKEEQKAEPKIIKKRLNDLDFNIFQEGSFLDIKDSELSPEEKIKKIKGMIKKTDEKIYMLEDSDDDIILKKLRDEREALFDALSILNGENSASPVSELISKNEAVKEIAGKMHLKDKIRKFEKIVFKFCPLLHKSFLVRKALNKLVMLNESAKNLCSKQIPYGESEGRYNDFIAYLSCANVIHAKLTKKI